MAALSDDELDYLSPSFDPSTLVVPRLRAILVSHDIPYPASAKKAQLIEIFNQQLVPKSRKILAARTRMRRTSKGITNMPSSQESTIDGDTETESMPPPPVSNSSRRTTRSVRASTEDSTDVPAATRRMPGRPATKHPRTSDNEAGTEPDTKQPPVRKTRKSETTPTVKIEEPEPKDTRPPLPGSVFSNDNPFQSGSSPPASGESRRKSAGTRSIQRQSSSGRRKTDGVVSGEAAKVKYEDGTVVPSSKTFEVPVARLTQKRTKERLRETTEPGEEFTPEEQLELVRERAANGEVDILPPRRSKRLKKSSRVSKSAPWVILTTILTGYAIWWRQEKIQVGYCGIGKFSTALADANIPEWALDWVSTLQPQCELCPPHAFCYADMEVKCEENFVLKSHPLSLGGLVPLPPSCDPDGEKVRKIKTVADRAIIELRERRAHWECGDLTEPDGEKATSVEIEEPSLKAAVSQKRRKGMTDGEFEELWKGAIGEITDRDEVTSDIDGNTHSHRLSSNSLARLPLTCAIRRSARLTLARYRVQLVGLVVLLSGLALAQNYITTRRSDNARIPQLVSTTLDRLATQAALHAQGASQEAYISIGQMRDDVLRDEFSTTRRLKIWQGVESIVGANANVRTVQKEDRAGDYSRVWEWIGSTRALEDAWSTGRSSGGRPSLGPVLTPSRRVSPEVEEMGAVGRKWDEGRPIY